MNKCNIIMSENKFCYFCIVLLQKNLNYYIMKRILLVLLVISSNLFSQELPNRIIINKPENIKPGFEFYYYDEAEYVMTNDKDYFSLYRNNNNKKEKSKENDLELIKKVSLKQISNLINEINNPMYDSLSLSIIGIDTNYIKDNSKKYFHFIEKRKSNKKLSKEEREYSYEEIKNISNYEYALKREILSFNCGSLYPVESNMRITLLYNDSIVILNSNNSSPSHFFIIPWTFEFNGKKSFNMNISKSLFEIFGDSVLLDKNIRNKDHLIEILLKNYVVDKIKDDLLKISYKQFSKEINELKKEFQILSINELSTSNRYDNGDYQRFNIELKNSLMQDNVYLQCTLYNFKGKLYTRDSILKEYKDIVNRVQSIDFISEYLSKNPNSRLDIYYFNNNGISEKTIEGFNGTPKEWEKYDKDISEGKEEYLNFRCGCNFRLDNEYLKGSIVFDLVDEDKLHSTWILLPDNTPVLYILDSDSIFNYSRKDLGFDQEHSYIHPCKKFDRKGNIIN